MFLFQKWGKGNWKSFQVAPVEYEPSLTTEPLRPLLLRPYQNLVQGVSSA